ncbi:MAG TPA: class I adenylate-forming enzyme family protein [Acidimicrobiales bacterium]|nr:class I adenylate-forming enzyme family protein [Acidimicrobiales bacterium]
MTLLVGRLLADAATVNPDGTAATLDGVEVSYRQLERQARAMTGALLARRLPPGQRVVWWCDPDLRSLAGFAAVARAGLVFAPLNPAFSPDELAAALDYLHPALVVADAAHLDAAHVHAGHLDAGHLDAAGSAGTDRPGMAVVALDQLAGGNEPREPDDPVDIDDDAPQIIYLTSGTTGRPKGVVVSHRASWLRSFPGGSTFAAGLAGDGGILVSFPLFHYGGWHYVLEAWHHRTAFHICRRFDGPSLVAAAERWRPTAMYCIPAVWNRVLAATPDGAGLESVRHADTGTSAAPAELLERLRAAMPAATTSVLYGSSEGGHHTTLHHRDAAAHPGSVGRVAPPGVIRLADDGEILYRGPTLMDGYFERPDETEAALAGGWYHTGDLGTMDADGFVWITGRAKEIIRTGGESVAPVEVEQALAGLPGVSDLAVVGVTHPDWGEVVVVALVADGPVPDGAAVRAHLEGRLARFKHPRLVVAVPAIPRTPATGQIQRTLLRDVVSEKL